MRIFCVVPQCWGFDIMHLSKHIECTTQHKLECKLWTLIMYQDLFTNCNKCTVMQDIIGDNVGGYGNSWYSLLNFSVNVADELGTTGCGPSPI